jgi:hypothetical protein
MLYNTGMSIKLLASSDVEEKYGIPGHRLRRSVKAGDLRAIRFGETGWYYYKEAEIKKLLRKSQVVPGDSGDNSEVSKVVVSSF